MKQNELKEIQFSATEFDRMQLNLMRLEYDLVKFSTEFQLNSTQSKRAIESELIKGNLRKLIEFNRKRIDMKRNKIHYRRKLWTQLL